VPSATHTFELVPGTTFELIPGTVATLTLEGEAARKAMVKPVQDGALAEAVRDDWGLCPRSADDLAAVSGCRVEVSGLDNPHLPLTDGEVGDPPTSSSPNARPGA